MLHYKDQFEKVRYMYQKTSEELETTSAQLSNVTQKYEAEQKLLHETKTHLQSHSSYLETGLATLQESHDSQIKALEGKLVMISELTKERDVAIKQRDGLLVKNENLEKEVKLLRCSVEQLQQDGKGSEEKQQKLESQLHQTIQSLKAAKQSAGFTSLALEATSKENHNLKRNDEQQSRDIKKISAELKQSSKHCENLTHGRFS